MNLITTAEGFWALLLVLMTVIFGLEKKYPNSKVFKVIPGMLWLMLAVAACATLHVFDPNAEGVCNAQNLMYTTFLPMMLIMFMLTCDVRDLIKLGPRMILSFFCTTVGVLIGLTVAYLLLKNHLPAMGWGSVASVAGSWVGETINMRAVAAVFGVEGTDFAYAAVMDTVGFTIVLAVAMFIIPRQAKWNKFFKASTDGIDAIAVKINASMEAHPEVKEAPTMLDYAKLFAVALTGTAVINWVIPYLNFVSFLNATGWRVVLGSLLGIALGLTPLHWSKGATNVANVFLYLSLCVAMSYSDLSTCTDAPWFILLAIIAVAVLYVVWLLLCKLFKLDAFTASVGFMANFGGTSSAPAIAAAYNPNWIGFGILLGFFGDVVGTWICVAFGYFLQAL
ncbi:MAG: DUF819 family protein [Clostridia bacterium]|nr:DUF819 family protein [Clostridia bacterium]